LNDIFTHHCIAKHFTRIVIELCFLLIVNQRKLNDIFCYFTQKVVFLLCKDALKEEMLPKRINIFLREKKEGLLLSPKTKK